MTKRILCRILWKGVFMVFRFAIFWGKKNSEVAIFRQWVSCWRRQPGTNDGYPLIKFLICWLTFSQIWLIPLAKIERKKTTASSSYIGSYYILNFHKYFILVFIMWFCFSYSSSLFPFVFVFFSLPVPLSVEVEFLFECSFGFLPICPRFLHEGFFRAEHFCSCIFLRFFPPARVLCTGVSSEQQRRASLSRRLLSSSFALAGALTLDFLIAELLLLLLLLIFILAAQLKS